MIRSTTKSFVVRTVLLIDFLCAIPLFVALLFVSPELYARTLATSGETIRARIEKLRVP